MITLALWFAALTCTGSTPSGQIAFVSGTEQEDQCVCVRDLDSGTETRVGPGALDGAPTWAADGSRLAFQTRQPDGIGVYVVNADGSAPRLLKHQFKWNRNPRWSPDGALLAYEASDGERIDPRIMVYDFAAQTETPWGGETPGLMRPVWMPNLKILETLRPEDREALVGAQTSAAGPDWLKGNTVIVAIGLVGEPGKYKTNIFFITPTVAITPFLRADYVAWAVEPSPSGWNFAFESNDGGDREIFIISKSAVVDISNHHAADWNPVWSSDGQWIAFESFRGGRRGVYRVHPETGRISTVAAEPDSDSWSPTWSPDRKWIAFVSTRTGNPQIFIADPDGKKLKQVTEGSGNHVAPAWRPKGKKK